MIENESAKMDDGEDSDVTEGHSAGTRTYLFPPFALLLQQISVHAILLHPITLLQRMRMPAGNSIILPIKPVPIDPLDGKIPPPLGAGVTLWELGARGKHFMGHT